MEEFVVCEVQNETTTPYAYPITGSDPTHAEMEAKGKFHEIMFAAYHSQVAFHEAYILRITCASGKPEMFIYGTPEFVKREVSA